MSAVTTDGMPATANAYFGAYPILKVGWVLFDRRVEELG